MSKRGSFDLGLASGGLSLAKGRLPSSSGKHGFDIPRSEEAARAAVTERQPAIVEPSGFPEALELLKQEGKSGRSS